jgi:hypothetical protein
MAIKITHTSSNPNFLSFEAWISEKRIQAELANNTAEVQKIDAALAAKAAAAAAAAVEHSSIDATVENGVTKYMSVQSSVTDAVPEFDEYWNQYAADFNIEITIEPA